MRYAIIKSFTIKTSEGRMTLPVGKVLELSPEQAERLGGMVRIADASFPPHLNDWRPEPRAWITESGELMSQGVFPGEWPEGGLTPEIIKLTADNLALQAKLLRERVAVFTYPYWQGTFEIWDERAAIMEHDGGLSRKDAEQHAAEILGLVAFLDELRATA